MNNEIKNHNALIIIIKEEKEERNNLKRRELIGPRKKTILKSKLVKTKKRGRKQSQTGKINTVPNHKINFEFNGRKK